MLKIHMAGLSEEELAEVVARHCVFWGTVKKLRIYPAGGTLARPFALVDMETAAQAEGLAAAFGRHTMGNAVVIVLQQDQADIPTLLPVRSSAPAVDNTLSLITEELGRQI